jgi:hypothetical protein
VEHIDLAKGEAARFLCACCDRRYELAGPTRAPDSISRPPLLLRCRPAYHRRTADATKSARRPSALAEVARCRGGRHLRAEQPGGAGAAGQGGVELDISSKTLRAGAGTSVLWWSVHTAFHGVFWPCKPAAEPVLAQQMQLSLVQHPSFA